MFEYLLATSLGESNIRLNVIDNQSYGILGKARMMDLITNTHSVQPSEINNSLSLSLSLSE